MDYLKFIVSNQKEESISIQRVKEFERSSASTNSNIMKVRVSLMINKYQSRGIRFQYFKFSELLPLILVVDYRKIGNLEIYLQANI